MADGPLTKYDVSISCGSRNTNGHLPGCSDHWRDLHGGWHPSRALRALGIYDVPQDGNPVRVDSKPDPAAVSTVEQYSYRVKIKPVNGD